VIQIGFSISRNFPIFSLNCYLLFSHGKWISRFKQNRILVDVWDPPVIGSITTCCDLAGSRRQFPPFTVRAEKGALSEAPLLCLKSAITPGPKRVARTTPPPKPLPVPACRRPPLWVAAHRHAGAPAGAAHRLARVAAFLLL
jgi:hypothetical protein